MPPHAAEFVSAATMHVALQQTRDGVLGEMDGLRGQVRSLGDQNQAFVFRIKQLEDLALGEKDQLDQLRDLTHGQTEYINEVRDMTRAQVGAIETLRETVRSQGQYISELQETVREQGRYITELRELSRGQTEFVNELRGVARAQKAEIEELRDQLVALNKLVYHISGQKQVEGEEEEQYHEEEDQQQQQQHYHHRSQQQQHHQHQQQPQHHQQQQQWGSRDSGNLVGGQMGGYAGMDNGRQYNSYESGSKGGMPPARSNGFSSSGGSFWASHR